MDKKEKIDDYETEIGYILASLMNGDKEYIQKWMDMPLSDFGDKSANQIIAEGRAEDVYNFLKIMEAGHEIMEAEYEN